MSIHVRLGSLPDLAIECEIRSAIGQVPAAHVAWRFDEPGDVPSPSDLIGQRLEISLARFKKSGRALFVGEVYAVSIRRPRPHMHVVSVEALTIPAKVARSYELSPSWRTFEKGTSLTKVVTDLLEDAGFKGASPSPGLSDSISSQLVAAGAPAWRLIADVLAFHGARLALRADVDAKAGNKFGIVKKGSDLAALGTSVKVNATSMMGDDDPGLLDLAVTTESKPQKGRASWFDVREEKAWSEGGDADNVLAMGPTLPDESTAKALGTGLGARLASHELRVEAVLSVPLAGVGDALGLEGDGFLAGSMKGPIDDGPIVYSMHATRSDHHGSTQMRAQVKLIPKSSPVPLEDHGFHASYAPVMLTGTVLETPEEQGKLQVELDVPGGAAGGKPPKLLVEWVPHWLSGEKGGLHMPPLPKDHVVLLYDGQPFGRVIYVGAHPSTERVKKVRDAFTKERTAKVAAKRSGTLGNDLTFKGDHLARALIVGQNNVNVWCAPDVGLASGAGELASVAWRRLTAKIGESVEAVVPGKVAVQVSGGDAVLSVQSENAIGAESKKDIFVVAAKKLEATAENVDGLSKKGTKLVAKDSMEIEGKTVKVTAETSLEEAGQTVKISAKTSLEESGQTVKVEGAVSASIKATTMEIQGTTTSVKGTPLNLN